MSSENPVPDQRPPARDPRVPRRPLLRFIGMRLGLMPAQLLFVLFILYFVGGVLPASLSPETTTSCVLTGASCTCPWSNFACTAPNVFKGAGVFIWDLVTGNWGISYIGQDAQTSLHWLEWWGPHSIQLAVFGLGFSALLAYPLGLRAGWRPGRPFDATVRIGSATALLVPSIIVLFLLPFAFYGWFLHTFDDSLYGSLPGTMWYQVHGLPSWVGIADNTSPTGYPLLDALIHGNFPFFTDELVRTVIQALAIALVYVGVFLRYARYSVVGLANSPSVIAAKARGIDDRTLLWHHVGRRYLALYLLAFAATIPAYIVIQSFAEVAYSDQGIGAILFLQFVSGEGGVLGGLGFFGSVADLYSVIVFLIVVAILVIQLIAEVLARTLDPTIALRRK
jgi:ABC-type dipeptide/oligopeptide/nickel transport system permease component